MEIKIALFHKGIMATYIIDKIDANIFHARLKEFAGDKPPLFIKFIKTELGWKSAFTDAELIRELGSAIDNAWNTQSI